MLPFPWLSYPMESFPYARSGAPNYADLIVDKFITAAEKFLQYAKESAHKTAAHHMECVDRYLEIGSADPAVINDILKRSLMDTSGYLKTATNDIYTTLTNNFKFDMVELGEHKREPIRKYILEKMNSHNIRMTKIFELRHYELWTEAARHKADNLHDVNVAFVNIEQAVTSHYTRDDIATALKENGAPLGYNHIEEPICKAKQLEDAFQVGAMSYYNHAVSSAACACDHYKECVDFYLEIGAADCDTIYALARRGISDAHKYFVMTTTALHKITTRIFDFAIICFSHQLEIRDMFVQTINLYKKRLTSEFETKFERFEDSINNYRRVEVDNTKQKYMYRKKVADNYFSKETNIPIYDFDELGRVTRVQERKTYTGEEYNLAVEKAASCYKSMLNELLAHAESTSVTAKRFVEESINESLLNECAVFDPFIEFADETQKAAKKLMDKIIDNVHNNMRIRLDYMLGNCISSVEDNRGFDDAVRETEKSVKATHDDIMKSLKKDLKLYKLKDRKAALHEFDMLSTRQANEWIDRSLGRDGESPRINLHEYKLEKIGEGAQAEVFSFDLEKGAFSQKVCAKRRTPGSRVEILMCKLRHDNISHVIDCGTLNNETYFIYQFHPSTLAYELDNSPSGLDKHDFLKWTRGMAAGMEFMDLHGIYHGDLKPANILISANREAKLADFGVSLVTEEIGQSVKESNWKGTPEYMAPEQHKGLHILAKDHTRCDVWSYGVVAWEMMTNRRPYAAIERAQLTKLIGVKCVHPELPVGSGLEALCYQLQCCWYKEHRARPFFRQIVDDWIDNEEEILGMSEDEWREECVKWQQLN